MKKRIFDELPHNLKIEAIHDFGRFIGDFTENSIAYSLFLMPSYYLEIRRKNSGDIAEINTYDTLEELHQNIKDISTAA